MAGTFVLTAQMQVVKREIEVSCLKVQLPLLYRQTYSHNPLCLMQKEAASLRETKLRYTLCPIDNNLPFLLSCFPQYGCDYAGTDGICS